MRVPLSAVSVLYKKLLREPSSCDAQAEHRSWNAIAGLQRHHPEILQTVFARGFTLSRPIGFV